MAQFVCHLCGEAITCDEPIPRDSACTKCGTDLRCCRNCRHWDARYNNECTETQADPVQDKTRRNFCEFIYFSREPFAGAAGRGRDRAAEARARLEAMFGGAGGTKRGPGEGAGARDAVVGEPVGPAVAGGRGADAAPGAAPGPAPATTPPARSKADEARANLEKLFGKPKE